MNFKEAIEYLVNVGEDRVKIVDVNNQKYSTKNLVKIDNEVELKEMKVSTLSGLVDYMKSEVDSVLKDKNNVLIRVESPTTVRVEMGIDSDGRRQTLLCAKAIVPLINFDFFYETEAFNILLQSAFISSEHRDVLLKVVGNIKEEVIKSVGDDGISQAATIKTGVATIQDVKVPNPVTLTPRRTFVEVKQPQSSFVFRMKDGPRCALFEADGGAWRIEAMNNIKEYLLKELGEMKITIIS